MRRIDEALVQIVALSLWLGAAGLFVSSVAPAAFAALPTRTLAGAMVGRVLPAVFYAGIAVGIAVAILEVFAGRSVVGRRGLSATVMVVACASISVDRWNRSRQQIRSALYSVAYTQRA
jgi:Domain of unknown function (DUF4149)